MRIAVSSSTFRPQLTSGALTQLEWVERCASALGVDGIVADIADFPRIDVEYVAQLRKVAVDLGIVPFGLDAPALLALPIDVGARDEVLAVATAFGALVVRTQLPPPGEVPPATFVETVAAAKAASRAAKGANVTLVVGAAAGTIGEDLAQVKHLLKDVDSAWLRLCPVPADAGALGPRDRVPAYTARTSDEPSAVAAAAGGTWVILEAPGGSWDDLAAAIGALRRA